MPTCLNFRCKYVRLAVCIWGLLAASSHLLAQTAVDSLLYWQHNQEALHWLPQSNAVWQPQLPMPQYGMATATATQTSGNYHLPMQAQSSWQLQPAMQGMRMVGAWQLIGGLAYSKQYDRNLAWSNVYDAYAASTLLWADSGRGNWERDHIKAHLQLVSPVLAGRWRAALGINYHIGTGARNTDPKPFYRYRHIAVLPGISYTAGKHTLAISGEFGFEQEENELGFFARNNVLLYRLRGYGLFSRSTFVNGERKRTGYQATGNVQWEYKPQTNRTVLLHAFAGTGDEEVFEGVASPVTTGYYQPITAGANLLYQQGNMQRGMRGQLRYQYQAGYTDDVILRASSAEQYGQSVRGEWATWKQAGNWHRQWQLQPAYTTAEWVDQATQTQLYTATLSLQGQAIWRCNSTKSTIWQFILGAGYWHNVDAYLAFQAENTITKNLVLPAFAYWKQHRINGQAEVMYQWQQGTTAQQYHRVSIQLKTLMPTQSTAYNHRTQLALQYAFIF